jgi:hypothetical protein
MKHEDRELWTLLGRSPRPAAPPFFAGKVMRQIEAGPARTSRLAALLRWLAPAAVAAVAILALLPRAATPDTGIYEDLTTLDIVEMVSPEDYALLTSAEVYEEDDLLTAEL